MNRGKHGSMLNAKQLSRQDSNFTQVFQNARRVTVLGSAYLK